MLLLHVRFTMSHRPAPASSAAAASGPVPMEEDAGVADLSAMAAADAKAAKTAAATAAAAAACEQLTRAATGPFSKMHSSEQVLVMTDAERWDTMAISWCKPGAETISAIVDTWEGRDLAACVYKLGLPVIYPKKNYQLHMRRSVVEAVRKHARDHPELFEAPEDSSEGEEDSGAARASAAPGAMSASAPPAVPVQQPAAASGLSTPPHLRANSQSAAGRRSPRNTASSRSAAAAAIAALQQVPVVTAGTPHASPPSGSARGPARSAPKTLVPEVRLFEAGAPPDVDNADASSDDSDSDWAPQDDQLAVSLRHGGRLRRPDEDHELARAGVQRSFARGFIANAQFAAGGRSMFQLYKEVTSSFTESSRRECLALSRILDALLRGDRAAALELTCRRLGGVQTAAETGNWAMCERLETEAEQRSFVPDEFMRSALRSVTQMQAVRRSAADGAAGKGALSKAASASGRKERRSASKPYNNKKDHHREGDSSKDSGAGASRKKKGGSDSS